MKGWRTSSPRSGYSWATESQTPEEIITVLMTKTRKIAGLAIAVLLLMTASIHAQNPREVFERARMLDESNQNLSEAIKLYGQVVSQANEQRALAARAQYRIGVLYERMGRKADAQRAFQTVVKQYGDQPEASRARAKLPAASATLNPKKKDASDNGPTNTLVWQDNAAASVSPDGRYLSFTDWSKGDLVLRDLATGENRVIVAANNPKPGRVDNFIESSVISRDGSKIAYSWYDSKRDLYELWLANLRGDAKPRLLYGSPEVSWIEPTDWSSDGKWIAINTSESESGLSQVAIVSVDDGNPRVLKTKQVFGPSAPVFFSPDAKYVAHDVTQDATGARDVWVTASDGTTDSALVAYRGDDRVMGWSPDGKQLLFASDRMGSMALYSVGIRNGTLQGAPELLKPDMGLTQSIGVTTGGALFYRTQRGRFAGSIKVAQFDVRSGALTSAREVSTNPQENNGNPTWSPDGKYLAYLSRRGRPDANPVLVVRSAKTGRVVHEIDLKIRGSQVLAGWQPDSKALLVTGKDFSPERHGAFRVDVETGEVSFMFSTPFIDPLHMPAWSTDGHIYYWKRINWDEQVFMAHNIVSSVEREIVRRPLLGSLRLSPDGRFLATETIDVARNERVVLLVPLDGSAPREVMRVPSGVPATDLKRWETKGARISAATWVPDSQSFIARLFRQPGGQSELWQVPIDGTPPRKLPSMLAANISKFTLSPDGRSVAYRFSEPGTAAPPQVWKFENFLPASSRRVAKGTKSQ
jgi:Tol biopolymer transport system component